jgi:MFS family permease
MCTSFVSNFQGLAACRFFLGLCEGGVMPGLAYYLSNFYRRAELSFRVGIFIAGASMSGAFGGLLVAGLSQIPQWGISSRPIDTWCNIFFFKGLITILIAASAFYFLPSSPSTARFLSKSDQHIALERILREHKELAHERPTWQHVRRALFNINSTIYALGFFCTVSVQSLALFMPTILHALGWTALKTQLFSVPPYVAASIWTLFAAKLSDRIQRRGIIILVNNLFVITGFAILLTVHSPAIKYFAIFLAAGGGFPLLLSFWRGRLITLQAPRSGPWWVLM